MSEYKRGRRMPEQGLRTTRNMSNRTQYPPIEPFDTGHLAVGDGHEMYYEQSGNPTGKPALVRARRARRRRRRQRAAVLRSRSLPHRRVRPARLGTQPPACLARGQHDLAPRRRHGALAPPSWRSIAGSCSAARGAARSRSRMPRRIRRPSASSCCAASSCCGSSSSTWFYQFGASLVFPEQWQEYVAPIPPAERHDLLGAFHRRLAVGRRWPCALTAARAWSVWEGRDELAAAESEARGPVRHAGVRARAGAHRGALFRQSRLLLAREPAARRRRRDPADTGRHRARALRRRVPDRHGLRAASALARGRFPDRARRGPLGLRARHHGRARRGHGSIRS